MYWLQDSGLDVLREGPEPHFVLDYSRDGTGDEAFTAADISSLRDGPNAARDVIAYMSIGEAEDYRYYWQDGWTAGSPRGWMARTRTGRATSSFANGILIGRR